MGYSIYNFCSVCIKRWKWKLIDINCYSYWVSLSKIWILFERPLVFYENVKQAYVLCEHTIFVNSWKVNSAEKCSEEGKSLFDHELLIYVNEIQTFINHKCPMCFVIIDQCKMKIYLSKYLEGLWVKIMVKHVAWLSLSELLNKSIYQMQL